MRASAPVAWIAALIAVSVSALAAAAGCAESPSPLEGPSDPVDAARAFIDDAVVRRRALEASIAVADTPYGRLRAEHYALSGAGIDDAARDWDALPVFAPRVRRLRVTGAVGEVDLREGPVAEIDVAAPLDAWERAGASAFERAPAQLDLAFDVLRDRATASSVGLTVTDDGIVRGAVEVETAAGWVVSLSCDACHAIERDGVRILGPSNEQLDLAALGFGAWPHGTVDVTADIANDPMRPPDLRPIAQQARLHHTGNLANGRLARMVRIEALFITQSGLRVRPDRRVVAALALYLESLARTLPQPDRASPGARAFERECGACHRGDALAGPLFSADLVGTDPRSTRSGGERATGGYRAPSLLGVGDRRGLLHDGSAADLDAILGLAPSAHVGHAFGRELDEPSRRAIAAFLRSAAP